MGERDDMMLPEGKTCDDCAHINRCAAFGFTHRAGDIDTYPGPNMGKGQPGRTSCDFSPSRFRLPKATPADPVKEE